MVATRSGVLVCSPIKTKTNSDDSLDVQATPSTAQRTRRAAKQLDNAASEEESRNQPQESAEESIPSSQNRQLRRCTRSSRISSPQQSCTPAGSVHEADVSDMESSCSALSDSEPPPDSIQKMDRKAQPPRTASQEEEAGSEAESCSSVMPEKRRTRRSTRARKTPERPPTSHSDVGEQEASSQRATRSSRRSTRIRASAKTPGEYAELSDADSCVSGAPESPGSSVRATRSSRYAPLSQPIPLHLDAASEGSQSPAPRGGRRTRATRGDPASEPLSCDSEGFESGPSTPSRRRRRASSTAFPTTDSDSDVLEVSQAPGRAARLSVVLERVPGCAEEPGEGPHIPTEGSEAQPTGNQSPLNESKLELTVVDDADCTVLEKTITLDEEEEGAANADLRSIHIMSSAGCEVTVDDQQREPSQESECDAPPPTQEVPQLTQEVPPTTQEALPQTQEALPSVRVEPETALPPPHSEPIEMKDMEVDTSDQDARQEDGSDQAIVPEPEQAQAEPIQVNCSQDPKVKVDPVSEPTPQHADVVVHQKTAVISLLDSSEDDDDEEEDGNDGEIQGEDNVELVEPETAGSSKLPDGAGAGGLFMIDTRPGQGADQQYLKEGGGDPSQEEEEEEEEDFVDEEGDEDDDEDTQMLLCSMNPQTKELSTRIDPGLRVKELGGLYINFDGSKSKTVFNSLKKLKEQKIQDEVMKNSVLGPEFEKQSAAPPYNEAKRSLKLKRKEEREKTTGDGWFNMKAPELTAELKADLKVIKMRGALDPKRFYKKSDRDGLPKYFQVGTVMDSPVDFYHSRLPKKDRKRTMAEELMADSDFRRKNKKKYLEIMAEKTVQAAGRSKKKRFNQKKPAAV